MMGFQKLRGRGNSLSFDTPLTPFYYVSYVELAGLRAEKDISLNIQTSRWKLPSQLIWTWQRWTRGPHLQQGWDKPAAWGRDQKSQFSADGFIDS